MSKDGKNRSVSGGQSPLPDAPKKLPKSRSRRGTFAERLASGGLAWLLIVAIAALLTVVIRQQMKITDDMQSEDEKEELLEAEAAINVFRSSNLDFEIRPDEAFILDDLLAASTDPLPGADEGELNTHWVRQAGIHLVKAETAYHDNRLSSAIEHYRAALTIFPELVEIHKFIGLIEIQQKDYPAAMEALNQAVKVGFEQPEVYNNLGVAYLAQDDFEGADRALRKALALDADYPLARYNLAALFYKQDDYQNAAVEYEKYLGTSTSHVEAIQAYADCLVQLKEWEKAAVQLKKLTGELPDDAGPHFVLAQSLSMSENYSEAMDTLKHAITLVGSKVALAWMARDEFDKFREHENFNTLFDRLAEEHRE